MNNNIQSLSLLYSIKKGYLPEKSILDEYLSTVEEPSLTIINLFSNNIGYTINLENYLQQFLLRCNFYLNYNGSEREWYKFHILLCVNHYNIQYIQRLYNLYQQLPKLYTNNKILLWIQYQTCIKILTYYTSLSQDYSDVIKIINSIDNKIKCESY